MDKLNRQIKNLMNKGYSEKQISVKLKLHPSNVSRRVKVISNTLEAVTENIINMLLNKLRMFVKQLFKRNTIVKAIKVKKVRKFRLPTLPKLKITKENYQIVKAKLTLVALVLLFTFGYIILLHTNRMLGNYILSGNILIIANYILIRMK
jgi:hypothetical protein